SLTSPAARSARRCWESTGWKLGKCGYNALTARSPSASTSRIARWVGSATARKASLGASAWVADVARSLPSFAGATLLRASPFGPDRRRHGNLRPIRQQERCDLLREGSEPGALRVHLERVRARVDLDTVEGVFVRVVLAAEVDPLRIVRRDPR